MSESAMTAKVRELKELQRMADELAKEIAAIQDEIKSELEARQTEELIADVFKIRYTTVRSMRLNTTALKKAMPDVYQSFCAESVSRRFTIA